MNRRYILQDFLDLLDICTLREQAVIKFRVGIPDDRELTKEEQMLYWDEVREHFDCKSHTLSETAKAFDIREERVRVIENKVARKFQHYTMGCRLSENLN